jgi:hypothetical protein
MEKIGDGEQTAWHRSHVSCSETDLIERAPPKDRVNLLACFHWATWRRGRAGRANGREIYWEMR